MSKDTKDEIITTLLGSLNEINDLFEYRYKTYTIEELKDEVDGIFDRNLATFEKIRSKNEI